MATVQQQTTQLEFHQAMADFKTMFPDMDDEVIEVQNTEVALRTVRGWAPPLLGPLPDDFLRLAPSPWGVTQKKQILTPMSHQSQHVFAVPCNVVAISLLINTSSSLRLLLNTEGLPIGKKMWRQFFIRLQEKGRRLNARWHERCARKKYLKREKRRRKAEQAMLLSQQMLQQKYAENQRVRGVLCEVGDPELDRYLEDERIALFLQNEEFMAELRWNKDFLSTLEKVSRKKFAQLARVFTRRKKRSSAKNILSQGPAPSRDNLLLNAEPLLDDEDEDDESVPENYDSMRRPEHRE
ncbi:hypothetical protein C0J52_16273 [Blattella germanica]|nr:hypothetical protein C0J52_16273 [Blattella germanica]